jgi:serine/threonine protein phosphatase PrpC
VNTRQPEDDFIIIACDGIWDCLSNDDCVDLIRKHLEEGEDDETKPMTPYVEKMLDKIVAKDCINSAGVGTDNMTCMLVRFKERKEESIAEEY